jgi:ribonuclease HI
MLRPLGEKVVVRPTQQWWEAKSLGGPDRPKAGLLRQRSPPRGKGQVPQDAQVDLCYTCCVQEVVLLFSGTQDCGGDLFALRAVLYNSNATGNIAKWAAEFAEFQLDFQPRHAVKSQVLADFIMEWTPSLSPPRGSDPDTGPPQAEPRAPVFTKPHWMLFFDGSASMQGGSAGVVLIDPSGDQVKYMVHLEFKATNNMAEYEALIVGLSAALSLGVCQLLVKGDSQLIIKQVREECSCNEPRLAAYLLHVRKLEKSFDAFELQHVPRANNSAADELSARALTWAPVPEGVFKGRLLRPTAQPAELGEGGETSASKLVVPIAFHPWSLPKVVCAIEDPDNLLAPLPVTQDSPDAWISKIQDYLKENILPEDHVSAERIVRLAKRYTVVEGISISMAPTAFSCGASPRRRAASCSRRSMEASVEVILHPAHWSIRPFGMAFTG